MKQTPSFSRYTVLMVVILCYLLPVIGFSGYATAATVWEALGFGLLIASLGTLFLFLMMVRLQVRVKRDVNPELFEESSAENLYRSVNHSEEINQFEGDNRRLLDEIDALKTQLQLALFERDEAQEQVSTNIAEWENYRQQACRQMEEQQAQIHLLQETLAEKQSVYDKKQQQIGVLESKVGDLTYEIKTLLQLAETHSGNLYGEPQPAPHQSASVHAAPPSYFTPDLHAEENSMVPVERQVRTVEEASLQLKRCIDIAQKITGAQRFMTQFNAFRDYPADGFALDLRRLCDSLRSENNSTILLYSPKENQLLFANNQIRGLTGWSPDKFVQNFNDIIQDEKGWRQGLNTLAMRSEVNIELPIKTKSGHDISVRAHLGMIPTGIFKHHAIVVVYQEGVTAEI